MVRFAGCSRVLDAYAVATLFIRVVTIHLDRELRWATTIPNSSKAWVFSEEVKAEVLAPQPVLRLDRPMSCKC